jgi:hypothetical protein
MCGALQEAKAALAASRECHVTACLFWETLTDVSEEEQRVSPVNTRRTVLEALWKGPVGTAATDWPVVPAAAVGGMIGRAGGLSWDRTQAGECLPELWHGVNIQAMRCT